MLILQEPICGSTSYTRLQLVLQELHNILFIAFHTNAIGGHLNTYRTLHRLQLCFYWPGIFAYVKRMCLAFPGCALSNPSHGKSSELVYNFPIEAPFLVIHFNAYVAGKHADFEGSGAYLIGACGMCSFAHAWNLSLTLRPPLLPQLSCAFYFDMVFATLQFSIKIASSLVSAARRWTSFKLIVMFSQAQLKPQPNACQAN